MMIRVPVDPGLLRWACERSGIAHENLAAKFKKLPGWEDGETQPILKQLRRERARFALGSSGETA